MSLDANPDSQGDTLDGNGTSWKSKTSAVQAVVSGEQNVGGFLTPAALHWDRLRSALADRQRQLSWVWKKISELHHVVSELSRQLEEERRFGFCDPLTHLPNWRLLTDRFNQAIAGAWRRNNKIAVLFVDLEGFKDINNSLGHAIGDKLLKQVAGRLVGCVRKTDTVCRHHDDEFVVLLTDLEDEGRALATASKVRQQMADPFLINDNSILITTNMRVSVYPSDGAQDGKLIELLQPAPRQSLERRESAPTA
jgi:diguanylate cyclase (GGDEF)-like protein